MNMISFISRRIRRLLLAALVALACIQQASAAEPTRVAVTPTHTSVRVAEPFWLDWTVTAPAGAKVTFPATGEKLGDFDILDRQDRFDIPSRDAADQRTWTRRLQLESIVTGELKVPAIEIQVADGDSPQVVRSQPVPVQVVSVLEERGDPTQFHDIQSVVDVAVPSKPSRAWIAWTLAGLSALALAATAVAAVARRKRWLTPGQWALGQLDDLQRSSQKQHSDAAATQLAAIMQNFLQLQFSLPEPGRTPEELLQVLTAKQCLDATTHEQLRSSFALADEAKFAGRSVSHAELETMIAQARSLVERIASATQSATPSTAPATTEAR